MNRFFNEGVSSSTVSRVCDLSASVGQKCRQSCDISKSASPTANRRPNHEKGLKSSFNGIFESNPRSEGSVASDRSDSPVVSPMVALNHNRQSPPSVDNDSHTDNHQMDDNRVTAKRGRKRKVKELKDPLIEQFDTKKRIQNSKTTEELAQKFNIEVKDSPELDNNRIVTTIRTNKRHKNVSNVEIDDNETESKSELMQRFLSSQTSNTSPSIQEENDFNYNSHCLSYGDHSVTSDQLVTHSSGLCPHPSVSSEQTSYPLPNTSSYHQKTVSSDSVGDEINNILSHLPPLYVNDIVWSDCEQNDDKSSDNEFNSESNDDNRDHNHRYRERDQQNSDLSLSSNNSNSDNINNNLDESKKSKPVNDYEVDKYCEDKWESVNGTYDADTEWRPWNSMTTAPSFNGELLHILPYVDIDLKLDQNSDSE